MGDIPTQQWGAKGLPQGQPWTTYYDQHGRSFYLPSDPHSLDRYQGRGLSFHPPESPEPLVEDNSIYEGSVGATRQGPTRGELVRDEEPEMFGGLPSLADEAPLEPRKARGPDKKKRKKRKKRRNRA